MKITNKILKWAFAVLAVWLLTLMIAFRVSADRNETAAALPVCFEAST